MTENERFDEIIKEKLETTEAGQRVPPDWERMNARLDEEVARRQRLWVTKGIEVVLMSFAVWTISQFIHYDSAREGADGWEMATEQLPTQKLPAKEVTLEPVSDALVAFVPKVPLEGKAPVFLTPEKTEETSNFVQFTEKEVFVENSPAPYNIYGSLSMAQGISTLEANLFFNSRNEAGFEEMWHENSPKMGENDKSDGEVFANAVVKELKLPEIVLTSIENKVLHIEKDKKQEIANRTRLSSFVSANLLPSKRIYNGNTNNYTKLKGYSTGVHLNYQTSALFSLETGFGYTRETYEHQTVSAFGQTATSISGIERVEMNVIELPLNVQVNCLPLSNENWRVYAAAGISNRFVAKVNRTPQSFEMGNPTTPVVQHNGKSDALPVHKGLFEGGQLSDAHTVSLTVGGGVEKKLNKKWSIFVESAYKGALRDQSNSSATFALTGGTRVSL